MPHPCRIAVLFCGLLLVVGCAAAENTPENTAVSRCDAEFRYTPPEGEHPSRVSLVGDFNGWSGAGWELQKDEDGRFRGSYRVGAGRHLYRLDVDEREILDPANPLSRYGRDGQEHSLLIQPDCSQPDFELLDVAVSPDHGVTVRLRERRAEDGAAFDLEAVRIQVNEDDAEASRARDGDVLSIEIKGLPYGKHRLRVQGRDEAGRDTPALLVPVWVEERPFTWDAAIIYQVVTDRFLRGSDPVNAEAGITRRMGGDLDGIRHALESGYFDRMGVNTLWISPVNTNADGLWEGFDGRMYESYHGYWPVAPQEVEPRIGGAQALERLIDAAHARGIRVILDVVMNHVHRDHPYFQERRENWFNHPRGDCVCGRECSWNRDIQTCWFTDYLPDLLWTRDEPVDQVLSDTVWWLSRFDADGLRLDAVAMMPRLATRNLRHECDALMATGNAPVYLLGETYTGPGSAGRSEIRRALGPYGLDGQFDFPLMWVIRSVIAQGHGRMADLLDEADASEEAWKGSGAVMGLILGNHDLPRFLSVAAGSALDDITRPPETPDFSAPYQKMALAFAFLFSLPGAPIVYYGDEFGMAGGGDPDNRRPMRFSDEWTPFETELADRVAWLGRLRRHAPAMQGGERRVLLATTDQLAYLLTRDDDVIVVAMNRGETAARIRLTWPDSIPESRRATIRDCLGSTWEKDGPVWQWVAPPYGLAVLASTETCHDTL